jgi:hypothetical protein
MKASEEESMTALRDKTKLENQAAGPSQCWESRGIQEKLPMTAAARKVLCDITAKCSSQLSGRGGQRHDEVRSRTYAARAIIAFYGTRLADGDGVDVLVLTATWMNWNSLNFLSRQC